LVIDIGGTSAKIWGPDAERLQKIRTGENFTPDDLVDDVRALMESHPCDVISVGYPGKVADGRPVREPWNLGSGWTRFDFEEAFGKPVRLMNDAAMQALGAYDGGCMLFLGLGTSVGSALVIDGVVAPLELGNIPFSRRTTLEDILSKPGLRRVGRMRWSRAVLSVLPKLQYAFMADYLVLGGGNAKLIQGNIPSTVRLGGNHDAYLGGVRLWNTRSLGAAGWYHEGENGAGEDAANRARLAAAAEKSAS
jgi:predicted NBD/HSP70 family sugar kinase